MKKQLRSKLLSLVREGNTSIVERLANIENQLNNVNKKVDGMEIKVGNIKEVVSTNYDDIKRTISELYELRRTDEYKQVFKDRNPLISIRIATYNRSSTLMNKAIKSILDQTHQNFEVVIVGDHCTDDTEQLIKGLEDKRFRFINLPIRTVYPEDRVRKWQVIGAPAMNLAAELAEGKWIAPLDDDDLFTKDHLEKLLNLALGNKAELAYGALKQVNKVNNTTKRIYSNPPQAGGIGLQGAIYMKLLNPLFKYDFHSYVLNEVADWTMVRRMMECGVHMVSTRDYVGTLETIPPGHKNKDY